MLIKLAFLFPVLIATLACVPIETTETDNSGVTPIAPPRFTPEVVPTAASSTGQTSSGCDRAFVGGGATATASPAIGTPTPAFTPEAAGPRIASPQDVPRPSPQMPIPSRTDVILEGQIRLLLGANEPGYGIYALDLDTGRSVSINEDYVFYSASLFKLWVMYEVFHQEALGYFSLDSGLVMTPYYESFGLGPRATELCQQLTVMEALEAMMSISDNAAAVLLQDLVGAPNINHSLEALGLTDSRLTTDDIPLTAKDTALLLQFIATGKAVSRQASERMAGLMLRESFDNGLVAGVPSEAAVAHKTGNWPNARHDAAIVFAPKSTYILVVLSDNREGSYAMTEAVSRAVYDAFNR